ncbi:hypothetical protein ABS71_13405 [bacterium SCN 62-11]|nr:MAG: hypothetical protein ABS71_13405 [bacterium SCN 62-11]
MRRAFSLLELVLGMAVLMAFLTVTYFTLAQGVRYVRETDSYAYPQKEGAVLLRKLSEELANSHERWVIPGLEAASIRFLSAEGPETVPSKLEFNNSTGRIIWKKWVSYVWDPAKSLVTRYEMPLSPTTSDLTTEPDPGTLPDEFPTLPNLRKRVVGRNIVDFKVVPSGTSQQTLTVTSEKQVPVSTRGTKPERVRVTMQATVVILNQDP